MQPEPLQISNACPILSFTASGFEIPAVSLLQPGAAVAAHRDILIHWREDSGHQQGLCLWLCWFLAWHWWDCSNISMGSLLAAVKISLVRSLEANCIFWLLHLCNQLDLPPSWHNGGKTTQPSSYHIWLPLSHKWIRIKATQCTLFKARAFRIKVCRHLLFWHIVCMKAASHPVSSILQYCCYACF